MRYFRTFRAARGPAMNGAGLPRRTRLDGALHLNPLETEDPPGAVELRVRRHRGGEIETRADHVGQEWPVALVFNGISHAVMMCTPRDLEAFAVGFAISEGIVGRNADIQDIEVAWQNDGDLPYAQVQLTVVQEAFVGLKEKRRALAGRTGCGVCGIESVDLLDLEPEKVPDTGFIVAVLTAPLLLALCGDNPPARVLASPVLFFLGEISYSIYLGHFLYGSIGYRLLDFQWVASGWGPALLALVAINLLVIGLSTLTFYWIEGPARDWLSGARRRPVAA